MLSQPASKKISLPSETRQNPVLAQISAIAEEQQAEVYVVGGYVRDVLLGRTDKKDLDFVVVGDGIAFARAAASALKRSKVVIYKKFGTAMLTWRGHQLEFVGARRESYRGDSRNPDVEPADLQTDLARRDFTINAMALSLAKDNYLHLLDPFNGQEDLQRKSLRTPLEPGVTFDDDPLRIMRGIRFATVLRFGLEPDALAAMQKHCRRLEIIAQERITEEFLKIMAADVPSIGLDLLHKTGALNVFLPEISDLAGVDEIEGRHHKDVFTHTLGVVDNLAAMTNKMPVRLAALFHDIGKPKTKAFDEKKGWTFYEHEARGARMLPAIFRRLRLPNDWLATARKLTQMHLRPAALTEPNTTDAAYRRLLFQAGEDTDDLMLLARADMTTANDKLRRNLLKKFDYVADRLKKVEEKDRMRAFQSPVRGEEIMTLLQIGPGKLVGEVKSRIEEAIIDGEIENNHAAARAFLEQIKKDYAKSKIDG